MNYSEFKIIKIKTDLFIVKTIYNEFQIIVDKVNGVAIYMMAEERGYLIKKYQHQKIDVALNYLIKKYL